MDGAALSASAQLLARIEPLEERREVFNDALQLHLYAVQEVAALLAIPLESVFDTLGAGALDHQADASGFRPLRRMPHMRRHKEDRTFLQFESPGLSILHDVEKGVALKLVEEFLVGIVVVVGALVRPAHDGDDEIRCLPDLRVADRRLEKMPVLLDPFPEVEWFQHGGAALTVWCRRWSVRDRSSASAARPRGRCPGAWPRRRACAGRAGTSSSPRRCRLPSPARRGGPARGWWSRPWRRDRRACRSPWRSLPPLCRRARCARRGRKSPRARCARIPAAPSTASAGSRRRCRAHRRISARRRR